jgi:hypothetical protein
MRKHAGIVDRWIKSATDIATVITKRQISNSRKVSAVYYFIRSRKERQPPSRRGNKMFKSIIYKGIPYIAFGYGAMFTSRDYEINKVWYLFDEYPVLLKTRLFNHKDKFRSFVREAIQKHPEMRIVDEYFDDMANEVEAGTLGAYHHEEVYAKNDNGMFYLGPLDSAYRKIGMHNFRTSTPTKKSGVAAVAKIIGEDKWCGWSHRAKVCFMKGDRIFDPSYGDEQTIFSEHGYAIIESENDMIEAASRFAKYVS